MEDLPDRVSGVLAVLFLVFNEGYLATGPDTDPIRHDLTGRGDPADVAWSTPSCRRTVRSPGCWR